MKLHLIKYVISFALIAAALPHIAFAQDSTPQEEIEIALNNYLNGSSYSRPEQIKSAFYPDSDMFLHHDKEPIYRMNSLEYAALFEKRERDVFNGRFGKILDIDVAGNIATAKAEILMPSIKARFFDVFILKKLDGEWKIISKAADRTTSERHGKRFLIIASETQKLSDVISVYEEASGKGYTVNIASPGGHPMTLRKIDMKNAKHKAFLYDADFMYALEHPLAFEAVQPDDYAAAKSLSSGFWGTKPTSVQLTLYNKICEGTISCAE